jgi:hypothetical protein
MAAILDPKTRFFDTFLTKEGRRQLASGEIRTRFISFSDSLTGYDQKELGVIDSKDGALFFEAMSRPQDKIVTENPSIINMMELRNPEAQPSFLAEGDDDDGPMTESAMFGRELLVPPDGRQIQVVTGSGIDKKIIDYDLRSSFHISGSKSQELFYNNKTNGFRGWWIFDESANQLSEFNNPSFLNFERTTGTSRTVVSTNGLTGGALTSSTTTITFNSNIDFNASVGDTVGFKAANGKRIAFTVQTAVATGNTPNLSVIYSPSFSLRADQAAADDSDAENENNSDLALQIADIDSIHFLSANIAQNLSSSSPLATNAAYMTYDSASSKNVIDPTPIFEEFALPRISDLNKSYKTKANSFIRVNLKEKHYNSERWDTDWGNSNVIDILDKYINQVSVWFNLKEEAFSGSVPTQTIMQFFQGGKKRLEVITVGPVLRVLVYNSIDDGITTHEVTNEIDPEKWHRISVVYGSKLGAVDTTSFLHAVVDGDKRKSVRLNITGNNRINNMTDLVLGVSLSSLNSQPNESRRMLGYIQECQYFILPSPSSPLSNYARPRFLVPAFGNELLNTEYDTFSNFADNDIFNVTGRNTTDNGSDEVNLIIDHYVRYNSPPEGKNEFVVLSGSRIDSRESLREWINYNPIRDEACLYFAALSDSYVKEQQLERGVSRSTVSTAANRAKSAMSGSLRAYRQLNLLQHLDLETNSGDPSSLLEASRYKVDNIDNAEKSQIPLGQTGFFKTRVEGFPLVEAVYGQSPHNYISAEAVQISSTRGPASGDFLKKAATVYHLNEIMDNELDGDELTHSSSRLPNYFFLPPIAADYFSFNHDGEPDTLEDVMAWTDFLRRRSRNTEQNVEKINEGLLQETRINAAASLERYTSLMESWYKSLIPKRTIESMVGNLGIGGSDETLHDSNAGLINYLTRDTNSVLTNDIEWQLDGFSEIIEFTATSESNASFIQMFEVAKEDGKVTFEKLAILDLGVINTSINLNYAYETSVEITGNSSREQIFGGKIRHDPLNSNFGEKENNLSHVFAFGKIIDDASDATPGAKIYFFPIFTLECLIEGD